LSELVFNTGLNIDKVEVAFIVETPTYSTSNVIAKIVGKITIVAETNEEVDPNLEMTCNYYRY